MHATQSAAHQRHGALILVVERDPHVQALESFFLEKAGYEVDFARDGREALEMAEARRPAIVITEILVPGVDGLSLCRRIKEREWGARTRVLIFSILAGSGRAREAGADAFLMKPLAEQKLVATVERLIGLEAGATR